MDWRNPPTFVRYALVGGVNTAAGIAIIGGLAALGWPYYAYTTIAYIVVFTLSFILNLVFTFRVSGHPLRRYLRFLPVNLANLAVVQLFQAGLIEGAKVPEAAAVVAGVALYLGIGYWANRRFVYNP